VLEDANLKLGSLLSDLFGASGQMMLEALLKGKAEPQEIGLVCAEAHTMTEPPPQHGIGFSLDHMRFPEEQIARPDDEVVKKTEASGYTKPWELLRTLPAVDWNAAAILAEMGPDPAQFPARRNSARGAACARATMSARAAARAGTQARETAGCEAPWRRAHGRFPK
jgi:transposase